MKVLDKEDALSDDVGLFLFSDRQELNLLFRHLLQKKYFQSIMDLTEVLFLLEVLMRSFLDTREPLFCAPPQSSFSKRRLSRRTSASPP